MAPKTIYILYYITTQASLILNTYPHDTKVISIHGHFIYLYSVLNPNDHLNTKEKYDNFKEYIVSVTKKQNDSTIQLQKMIREIYHDFFLNDITLPTFDSARWKIDLGQFNNLKAIQLSNLYLYEIKNIPSNVSSIEIENCFLKKIDDVPSSLECMYCDNNQLTKLPKINHTNLIILSFKNNNIYQMPILPDSIKDLIFSNNQIMNIPNFPKSLKYLECSWNRLHNLNNIPRNIRTIICDHNDIVKLPCLSNLHFLNTFICNSNEIMELPPLPGLIDYINFSDNPITIFVPFPFSLIE
jgi:hypothetical protein